MKTLKRIINKLPTQWWVLEGHWSKTTWRYVVLGKHIGNKLKLGAP